MTAMDPDLADLLVGALRTVLYAGFVLLAGTLAFWTLVWPDGPYNRRQLLLVDTGLAVLGVGTLLVPVVAVVTTGLPPLDALSREGWVAVLLRLAVLVAVWAFLSELVDAPIRGRRRLAAAVAVVALTVTMVLGSEAVALAPVWLSVVTSFAHLLAMATWLGGLLALAVVILPRQQPTDLEELIPAFSRLALDCIVVLVVTGAVQAAQRIGGVDALTSSSYGVVLLVKVAIFVGLLVLAVPVRRRTDAILLGRLDVEAPSTGTQTLALLMGAQLATAAALLAATAALVAVAPL
ncbi:CopD family protein [Humibacillus xanthopallidus]|uniref:CopD family protein n=1 Tax=Humibacillus xanthopallidus TaxID=412689 RepID=UPI00384ABCF0